MNKTALACLWIAPLLLLAPPPGPTATMAEEAPQLLVRIERIGREDLAALRAEGLPVVMELSPCLLMRGGREDLSRLTGLGYTGEILDADAGGARYLVVGLRPDSDRDALAAVGESLLEEENWVLLRLHPGATLDPLHRARVFISSVPDRPADPPVAVPRPLMDALRDGATPDPVVEKVVAAVDEGEIDRVLADLTSNPPTGSRYSLGQGCRDAADYCYETYGSLGLPAEYHDWNPSHAPNVIGEMAGAVHPERIYIVVGHLDDLPSSGPAPGADDNASGSVNVLESARVMSCWATKNTVRYLNATGEEQGLKGSHAYAQAAKDRGDDIRGVINMDMIAWEGDGLPSPEDLDVNYNGPSEWLGVLFAENASTYDTGLIVDAFYCPSLTASDHYAFWQRGYDAICGITDNENYCGHGGNYPYYHTSDDTIANCGNLSLFYGVVRTSVATLAEMAEPFKITFAETAYSCGGTARVLVGDRDLNSDPNVQESIVVDVWSGSETQPEKLALLERGTDSMIFEGEITLTTAPPSPGDGLLSVTEGDLLEAEYVDALDCDGATEVTYRSSSRVDCSAPLITGVHETDVTDVAAAIVWTTDEGADSVVVWGETIPPDQTATGDPLTTDHRVDLSGLQECTTYYYEARSTDPAGNIAIADNGGSYFHFETLGDFGNGLQACHEGQVDIEDLVYSCSDTVSFTVVDLDLNSDPEAIETVTLEVTSTTETEAELVTATETDINSSRFSASIDTAAGPPQTDGVLQAANGDLITVTYHDADDGTGAAAVAFDTADADCRGPAITGLRVDTISDARATVRFETDEPGDTVIEWGTTPALGQTASDAGMVTAHEIPINQFDTCETIYIRASSSDRFSQTGTASGPDGPFAFQTATIPGLYWKDGFETGAAGWSLEGEWEVGTPAGLGGSSGPPDPAEAYNNTSLLGHDLSGQGSFGGDYEASIVESAESPHLDATTWSNTKLLFYRRLASGAGDEASLWLWAGPGRNLYSSAGALVQDGSFQVQSFDIGPLVDGRPSIWIEFRQESDGAGQYSGWNVDDVIFKDGTLPDYGPCGGCSVAPAFAGATSADDDDACAAGSVTVGWDRAVAWGSGGDGSFDIYRDLSEGFSPSASNLVASGISALSYSDTSAPADQEVFYLVRAENDETCGSGPANGGLTDTNQVYLAVTDGSSQALPVEVDALTVSLVGAGAHVRLSWQAAPGSASYRLLRSITPDPADFAALAETPDLFHDDPGAGSDRETYYYLVRGLNTCGQEGP